MGKLIDEFSGIGPISDYGGSPGGGGGKQQPYQHRRPFGGFHSRFLANEDDLVVINMEQTAMAYRAEGNANIVLSLPKMRRVLRIRKSLILANVTQTGTNTVQPNTTLLSVSICVIISFQIPINRMRN